MDRNLEDSRCTDRVVPEAQAGVEVLQGAGGNGARRSRAIITFRPKHSQPQGREEPGDYT